MLYKGKHTHTPSGTLTHTDKSSNRHIKQHFDIDSPLKASFTVPCVGGVFEKSGSEGHRLTFSLYICMRGEKEMAPGLSYATRPKIRENSIDDIKIL